MPAEHLIIFVKNPIPGQVKTRIARTVGDAKAVAVYTHLLRYTQQLIQSFPGSASSITVISSIRMMAGMAYDKQLQTSGDLGERMANAFQEQFAAGATKVVIIGSDCLAITPDHLKQAFAALDTADIVIGPATDGGYYLLGMKQVRPFLFQDMPWSQPELRQLTELAILQHGLTFAPLETLTDIDEWSDYEPYNV